jgi:hypothetical protein
MARVTNQQIYNEVRELRTVLLGVPDTEDMGLYGEVKDTRKLVKEINGTVKADHEQVTRNTTWICALRWVVGLIILAFISGVTTKGIGLW